MNPTDPARPAWFDFNPAGSTFRLQEVEMLELVAQDDAAVAQEPLVEQRRVELAEVGVVLQVAVVKVFQARVGADQAALDGGPGNEQAGARAVIGALAAVLMD